MKNSHRLKLKLARNMMTKEDIKNHVPPFQTKAWDERKDAIAFRVQKSEISAKNMAFHRKERNKK